MNILLRADLSTVNPGKNVQKALPGGFPFLTITYTLWYKVVKRLIIN